jgi:hypothetical protein
MGNNDQSGRDGGTYSNVPIHYNSPWDAVRADSAAENFHISNMGIKFLHFACLPDPIHDQLQGDVRHSFDHSSQQQFETSDKFHRENNFIFFPKGIVWGVFTSNSKDQRNIMAGLYAESGASLTLNRFYEDSGNKVKISENDKLIPLELPTEFFSVNWQKFTHNPTGIDRLQFKADEIEFLIDSDGVQYFPNLDYSLHKGSIKWIDGGNRPGLNLITGQGKVCAVRYLYKPLYYVKTVVHDIRVKPSIDENGDITTKAGPMLVQVQADWVYLDRRNADDNDIARQEQAEDGENNGPR